MKDSSIKHYHVLEPSSYSNIVDNLNLNLNKAFIVFLNGELGSGKTTLVKKFLENYNMETVATSPTFTLINEYSANDISVFHYDLYRVKSTKELLEIGIDYYLEQKGLHFFEWPNHCKSLLPFPDLEFTFTILDNSRLLTVETNNAK